MQGRQNGLTGPITTGRTVIGDRPAAPSAFEPAGIDWPNINEIQKSDPTYGHTQVPDAIINSCSECCMEYVNGQPNLLGKMHRRMVKGCSQCPVGRASERTQARDGNGRKIFVKGQDGRLRPLTEADAVRMAADGTA